MSNLREAVIQDSCTVSPEYADISWWNTNVARIKRHLLNEATVSHSLTVLTSGSSKPSFAPTTANINSTIVVLGIALLRNTHTQHSRAM